MASLMPVTVTARATAPGPRHRRVGGRYLARDAVPLALEGSSDPEQRIVVVEFDSPEKARVWYESPSYRRALEAADGALDRRLFIVAGL